MKMLLLISLLAICVVAVAACGGASGGPEEADMPGASYDMVGRLFASPVEITMLAPLFDSWPIQDNWLVLNYIREATNANINITPNVGDVLSLMVAAGTAPDILQISINQALPLIAEGIAANFMEFEDQMPDFFMWLNDNRALAAPFFAPGGELFMIPQTDIGEANRQGWMFRQDVFDRHGLALPNCDEEFFDLLVRLREFYPGSNPLQLRNGLHQGTKVCIMASQWGASFTYYLDRNTNTWRHGAIEDNFRDYVVFMNRLFNENLIPQDFLSVSTRSWVERMTASHGFVTLDFLTRIDGFNIPMRETEPEFTLQYMPPFRGGSNGTATMQFTALNESCFVVYGNADNAIKLINWMFTDGAKYLLSWGIEGETFVFENGRRQFVGFADVTDLRARTGLSTLGMYARFDYTSHMSLFGPELYHAYAMSPLTDQSPPGAVSFTEAEIDILSTLGAAIQSHKEEMIARFIVNERSLSEWDAFVAEMERLGVDRIIEIHNTAQARQNYTT